MDSTAAKRTCFIEEDDGLASLAADMEAGVSGNNHHHHHHHQQYSLLSRPLCYNIAARSHRRGSLRSFPFSSSSVSSPRSVGRFYDAGRYEEYQQPHFLDACFLCKKPLASNKDIFMYRGDTPFCSEDCRQEQIEVDEAKEKNWNLSSIKALRKDQKKSKSTSPNKTKDYPFRASTVAAA